MAPLPITKLYRAVVLKLEQASELPGGLVKTQAAGLTSRGSQVSLRICISGKFPGDTDAAGPLRATGPENFPSWEVLAWTQRRPQEDPRPGTGSAGCLSGGIDEQ